MNSCFAGVLECIQGPSYGATPSYAQLQDAASVHLDSKAAGSEVVLLKKAHRICGVGGALANTAVLQDKAYFEVKVQQTGMWGVGMATKMVRLDTVPVSENAWTLREDGKTYTNGVENKEFPVVTVEEGDVIGVTYDHVELIFYRNGERLPVTISGVKGTVFPLVYVGQEAILDAQFSHFWHSPPTGFGEILMEQNII